MIGIAHKKYFVLVPLFLLLCTSAHVEAAQVSFVVISNPVPHDTAVIVEARINPEEKSLNAVEGIIGFFGSGVENISAVIVETGDSAFSLWPQVPEYSEKEKVIRFTGGSTEEISREGLLFRMRIFAKKSGDISLSWLSGSAYLSDGNGTVEGVLSRSLAITLAQSEPNQINPSSPDSNPPTFETIEVSRDPDVQEGKYFLSFHALDDMSGIDKYVIVEDHVSTEVNDGIYFLHNQDRTSKIVVIAYDRAGNSTSMRVPTKYEGIIIILASVLGCIIGVTILYRWWLRSRKQQHS